MPHPNGTAEQAFGILGTICWTVQLLPQVYKSYRDKDTHGLSHWFILLWGISGALQGIYVILQKLNIPLMVQPQLFGFLSFVCWGQCQYYGFRRSKKVAFLMTGGMMLFWGLFEFILIITLRPIHNRGQHAPAAVFGIISSVTISVALFPQYWEIYKCREVVGISILFISVDMLGGLFNDLSLAFKDEFDVIAAVTYTLVIVLDGVIVVAALILNPRARRRRQREAEQSTPDIMESTIPSMSLTHLPEHDNRVYTSVHPRLRSSSSSVLTSQPISVASRVPSVHLSETKPEKEKEKEKEDAVTVHDAEIEKGK